VLGVFLRASVLFIQGTASVRKGLNCFAVGATLVANNLSDRDEFTAEACVERRRRAAPADCDQFNLQA
jgi:hypothetical protein